MRQSNEHQARVCEAPIKSSIKTHDIHKHPLHSHLWFMYAISRCSSAAAMVDADSGWGAKRHDARITLLIVSIYIHIWIDVPTRRRRPVNHSYFM